MKSLLKIVGITIYAVISGLIPAGCAVIPPITDIDIQPRIQSSRLYNTRDITDTDFAPTSQQRDEIMRTGFLDDKTVEYGYYRFYTISNQVGYSLDPLLASIHILTLGTLSLFGVPTDHTRGAYIFHLDFYDSNGTFIKGYQENYKIAIKRGLYYGNKNQVKKKMDQEISAAWNRLLQRVSADSSIPLNQAFESAGPVTEEKNVSAMSKINSDVQRNKRYGYEIWEGMR